MKYKFFCCYFYLWVLSELAFSTCAANESVLMEHLSPIDCSVMTTPPAITTGRCNEIVVHRQTVVSGPEKIKVQACPLNAADSQDKEYLLYSDSPNQPVWLCRSNLNKQYWKDAGSPEFPLLTISIAGDTSDDGHNDIAAVSGYGSDSFDGQWPKKPRMQGRQVTPFLLETISAGLLPAEIIPFAFGTDLPEAESQPPVLFQQGLMSDDTSILVLVTGTRHRIYRKASMFADWRLVSQVDSSSRSAVDEESGDESMEENKLTRALAAVFGWEATSCTDIPGIWDCPKEGNTQSQQTQSQSTETTEGSSSSSGGSLLGTGGTGGSGSTSDDEGEEEKPIAHDHHGSRCFHPHCFPFRCQCYECLCREHQPAPTCWEWLQQKLTGLLYPFASEGLVPTGRSIEDITIDQAICVIGPTRGKEYIIIGFLLGIPYDSLTQLSGDEEQRTQTMLELAQKKHCLTPQRLITALSLCYGLAYAEQEASKFGIHKIDLEPDCFKQPASPDLNDLISARDAYLIIRYDVNTLQLAVEMGLASQAFRIEEEDEWEQRLIKLLTELEKQGLLNFGRLLSALKHQGLHNLTEYVHKLNMPPRQPDYQVHSDRVQALTQPLSLRDLTDIIHCDIPMDAVAQALGCPEEADPEKNQLLPAHSNYAEPMIYMLVRCLKRKGAITVNDVIKMLYHPELLLLSKAHNLAAALTGQPHDRQPVPLRKAYGLGDIVNLKAFGLALGLPERLMIPILTEFGDSQRQLRQIIRKAIDLDRLTPENLVYAMQKSGNTPTRFKWLRGVQGIPLTDKPVFLTREESGLASEEPMAADIHSEPITLANTGGLPLSHNWYWIGLAMGVSDDELKNLREGHNSTVDRWFKLLRILQSEKYETGHLYHVLCFLEDEEAVKAFPKELAGKPRQSLATLAPTAIMGHALIAIARALKDQASLLAGQLGLDDYLEYCTFHYENDPQRIIVELINESKRRGDTHTQQEFLDNLIKVVALLNEPEVKTGVLEAMSRTTQQEMPTLCRTPENVVVK